VILYYGRMGRIDAFLGKWEKVGIFAIKENEAKLVF